MGKGVKYSGKKPLHNRIFQGGVIGFICLVIIFLFGGDPEPGSLRWMYLPFLLVPGATSLSGVVLHFLESYRKKGGWDRTFSNGVAVVTFIILFLISFTISMQGAE